MRNRYGSCCNRRYWDDFDGSVGRSDDRGRVRCRIRTFDDGDIGNVRGLRHEWDIRYIWHFRDDGDNWIDDRNFYDRHDVDDDRDDGRVSDHWNNWHIRDNRNYGCVNNRNHWYNWYNRNLQDSVSFSSYLPHRSSFRQGWSVRILLQCLQSTRSKKLSSTV